MQNISKCKGQRIKDKFKGGVDKLNNLCDHINKKAMTWYDLNIEFSPDEVEVIELVQQTIEEMQEISDDLNENENQYDYLDLGYQVFMYTCDKCNGKVYVTRFIVNELGHNYNVYKCIDCGKEYHDERPNTFEHIKEYFNFIYKNAKISLSSTASEEQKIIMREELKNIHIEEDEITIEYEAFIKNNKSLKEYVLTTIEENGEIYKELIQYKNYFDRKIGDA